MRVIFACVFVAIVLGVAAVPVVAQPAGQLDIAPIIAALDDGEQIVRAPDAVAHIDEERARGSLAESVRVVVLPYRDESPDGGDVYAERVLDPMRQWALDHDVSIVMVTGLNVSFLDGQSSLDQRLPANLDELRTTTSTRDVTEHLLVLSLFGPNAPRDAGDYLSVSRPTPVPASPDRVAEVAATLRDGRIYNAPGRSDPIDGQISGWAEEDFGLTVRVAAFPVLEPGQPVVDYATPLGEAFPDDVVLVLHGDWIDVTAPDQNKALAARAFAYGHAGGSLLTAGNGANALVRQLIERLAQLATEPSFGQPQPDPPPQPAPFGVAQTISALAPWVLVGSAVVLAGAVVLRHRTRVRAAATAEVVALRAESASTMATITELGARMLSIEESDRSTDPVAAERHATALLLYDQAFTSKAMVEVRRVAEEGLEVLTGGESVPVPEPAQAARPGKTKRRKKPRKPEREFPPMPRGVWRKSR